VQVPIETIHSIVKRLDDGDIPFNVDPRTTLK
jgi:hypothetical protein